MKTTAPLIVIFLLLALIAVFFQQVSAAPWTNHTSDVDSINQILEGIEQRIIDAIQEKHDTVKYEKSEDAATLAELQEKLSQEEQKYLGLKEETDIQLGKKQAAELEVSQFTQHASDRGEELDDRFAVFRNHMESELALVDKIRGILSNILSKNVKGLHEHCDENVSCRDGFNCVDGTCLSEPGNGCMYLSDCTPDATSCFRGKCRLRSHSQCSYNDQCESSQCLSGICSLSPRVALTWQSSAAISHQGTQSNIWGRNHYSLYTFPASGLTSIYAGQYAFLGLTRAGSIVVEGHSSVNNPPQGENFIKVAAGRYHYLAIDEVGKVYVWGTENSGSHDVPSDLDDVIDIAGGQYFSVAVKRDGSLIGWGLDNWNQVSNIPSSGQFIQVSAGRYHACAVTQEKTVQCWGRNSYGESNVPSNLKDVVQVSCGRRQTFAVTKQGNVVAWGSNTNSATSVPSSVQGRTVELGVGCYRYHTVVVLDDGSLVGWGSNSYNQINVPSSFNVY